MSPSSSQAVIPSAPTRRAARKTEAPQVIDRKALDAEIEALARAHAGAPDALRKGALALFRKALDEGHALAREQLESAGRGLDCARALSHLEDEIIRAIHTFVTTHLYPAKNPSSAERLAIAAVGGYGRGTLAPGSDIDLLFLLPYKQTPWGESVVEAVLYMLWDYARTHGGTFAKLEDADFFGSVLRNGPVARNPDALARKRVLTPDLRAHINGAMWLIEMKTVHYGPSRYTRWPAQFNHAVERRAALVPVERLKDIIDTDQTVFNTPPGTEGPLQQRLRTGSQGFTGIATGAFGEWSQTLVDLIKIIADMGASRWMDKLAAPSPAQARSTLMRLMRGQLGMRVARGHARLILERARAVGGAGAEAGGFARGARYAQDAWHHQQHQRGNGGQYWGGRPGCARGRAPAGARGAGWRR